MIEVRVDLPGAGLLAQQGFGAVEEVPRDAPVALQELGGAANHRHDRDRLWMPDFRGEAIGLSDEPVVAVAMMGAFDRRIHGLDRQRASDAIPVTGVEREQQVAALKVGAANGVDGTERGRDRPAGIDAGERLLRNLRLLARREAQPAPRESAARRRMSISKARVGDFASFMPIASSTARTTR